VTRIERHAAPTRAIGLLVALVAVLAACSSPGGATSSWSFGPSLEPAASGSAAPSASAAASVSPSTAASAGPSASPSAAASPAPGGAATKITIGTKADDELEFDPDSVEVPTGALVSVTFENRAATLPHNLTFREPINVASSPVVAPGASETIEFTAPAPGDYVFACTIHPGMEGTLTVEAAG
jgi:plastocyanin